MKAAECYPVGVHLADEMSARGWRVDELAARIEPDESKRPGWILALELILYCSDMPMVLDGEVADALGKAFGTSPEFWIKLNDSYQRHSEPKA